MIRVYQRLGGGTGISLPLWLYMLVVVPLYALIGACLACYYVGKYAYVGGSRVVREVQRRRHS